MRTGARVLAVVILLVWSVFPVYWSVRLAFSLPVEVAAFPPSLTVQEPTPAALITILGMSYESGDGQVFLPAGRAEQVRRGLANSAIVSVIVTILTMFIALPVAYTFGRLNFPHKNRLFFGLLFSVALPPISIILPFYVLFLGLGLVGTQLGLIIVTLTVTVPMVTWMLIGFFKNLPPIERLARVDGFSRMQTLIRIVLPMAKTGIGVGSIIAFLFAWNEFTFAQILVNGTQASTIPPVISGFLFMHPEVPSLMATMIYSMLPPLSVIYILQRHITSMNIAEPIGG